MCYRTQEHAVQCPYTTNDSTKSPPCKHTTQAFGPTPVHTSCLSLNPTPHLLARTGIKLFAISLRANILVTKRLQRCAPCLHTLLESTYPTFRMYQIEIR